MAHNLLLHTLPSQSLSHLSWQTQALLHTLSCVLMNSTAPKLDCASVEVVDRLSQHPGMAPQALLELTAEQVADLMHLRRLYFTKRALLALQRKALVRFMASFDSQLGHPSDNCTAAAEVAARLKDNAFEETTVLYRIARAVWVGVSLCPPPLEYFGNHDSMVSSTPV